MADDRARVIAEDEAERLVSAVAARIADVEFPGLPNHANHLHPGTCTEHAAREAVNTILAQRAVSDPGDHASVVKWCGWCDVAGHTTDECTNTEAQERVRNIHPPAAADPRIEAIRAAVKKAQKRKPPAVFHAYFDQEDIWRAGLDRALTDIRAALGDQPDAPPSREPDGASGE